MRMAIAGENFPGFDAHIFACEVGDHAASLANEHHAGGNVEHLGIVEHPRVDLAPSDQ